MVYLTQMRMILLTVSTLAVCLSVVLNAFSKKGQFYPAMIYLSKSSRTMSAMYILAFLTAWQFVKFIKYLFFGTLRAIEIEHLIEKSWFAVIDTFILLAAFHEDLSPFFVAMVSFLFAIKSFHWLINDRIDHMEQSPVITLKFHLRSIVFMSSLWLIDFYFVTRAWQNVKEKGMSVDIAYGLEYAIMLIEVTSTYLRYILHTIDLRSENPWENKPIYIRYINIVIGIFELLLYGSYMAFMLMIPFIPLHIARRVYRAARDFQKSVYEVVTSHQAIRNLNTLYPDVSLEELQTANNVCIICREEMVQRCKRLPCNHIFHTNCLRSWFQRQHTCPTCRLDILRTQQRTTRQQQQQRNVNNQQPAQPNPAMMFPPMMGWPPPMGPPMAPPPNVAPPVPPQQQEAQPDVPNANPDEAIPTNTQPQPPVDGPPFAQFEFGPAMMPPPPPFAPPTMFGAQPDVPEGLFASLSDDQLRELEGMERANVEARILLLKNIQKLLDTAMLQMNQYTALMASIEYTPDYMAPPSPSPPHIRTQAGGLEEEPRDVPTAAFQRSQSLGNRLVETPTENGVKFKVEDFVNKDEENSTKHEQEGEEEVKSKIVNMEDLSEQELIRQRRLQRFYSVPGTISTVREEHEENDDNPSPQPSS